MQFGKMCVLNFVLLSKPKYSNTHWLFDAGTLDELITNLDPWREFIYLFKHDADSYG